MAEVRKRKRALPLGDKGQPGVRGEHPVKKKRSRVLALMSRFGRFSVDVGNYLREATEWMVLKRGNDVTRTTGGAGVKADIMFKSVASGESLKLLIDTASDMGLAWQSDIAKRSDGELALGFFDIQVFQVPAQRISVLVNLPIEFGEVPEPPKQAQLM